MAICVVVLSQEKAAEQLADQLQTAELPMVQCEVLAPHGDAIERIELLNPNLIRQRRHGSEAATAAALGSSLVQSIAKRVAQDT